MGTKRMISIALVAGIVSLRAGAALADGALDSCSDNPRVEQFTRETAALSSALKAKEDELSDEYLYTISEASRLSGPDYRKVNALESEIKELNTKIDSAARKYGVQRCCIHG